ncbi:MAG: cation:proton antiporter, partial [Thermoplasmata archaeon]
PAATTDPTPNERVRAGMLVVALIFCIGVAYLAATLQLAGILGAFFAGIALAEIAPRYGIDRAFDALNAFFVPFFFVFVGLAVGSLASVLSIWLLVLLITVLAVVGKLLAGLAEQPMVGRTGALNIGTGLMARGEVALVIAITAQYYGLLSDAYLGAIVVMAIATTIIGPVLFRQVQLRTRGRSGPEAWAGADTAPEPAAGGRPNLDVR